MAYSLRRVYKYPFLAFWLIVSNAIGQELVIDDDRESGTYGAISLMNLNIDSLNDLTSDIELGSFFDVHVEGSNVNMLGTYQLTDSSVVFIPRFLPDPEVTYIAYVNFNQVESRAEKGIRSFKFSFSQSTKSVTKVISFLPDLDTLPSNVLRGYITFSRPMGLGNPYDYIKILGPDGQTLDEPFVVIPEGLWDQTRTRLTVLFHPGRIKRGVRPNMSKGAVFNKGATYVLRLSKKWTDAEGRPLAHDFSKSFYTKEAQRQRIDVSKWDMSLPDVSGLDPLILHTGHNLDPVLFLRMIEIQSSEHAVNGIWENHGTSYLFNPEKPWKGGTYLLKVAPKLEDICGNTLMSAFDVESDKRFSDDIKTELTFLIR